MHTTALRALGLDIPYIAVEVKPADLHSEIGRLLEQGCIGFNVTIPHKQAVIPLLQSMDEEAKAIGAVNTVLVRDDALHGYNTDVYGFRTSLEVHRERIRNENVLLLGAGGVARAGVYSLINDFQPSRITIAARNVASARQLADSFSKHAQISICSFDDATRNNTIADSALIINATSVGMEPNDDKSPLPASAPFHSGQIVFDLIYTPLQTTLLKFAAAKGAITINGLEMLVQQGARSFEMFTGKQMPVDTVRKAVVKSFAEE